jgi:hypothetical protein
MKVQSRCFRHSALAAALTVLVMTGQAFGAGVTVGSIVKIFNQANHGTNGEFEVHTLASSANYDFEDFKTFCVEGGNAVEYFTPGTVQIVAGLGLDTLSDASPTNSPSLTKAVAALFREFTLLKINSYVGDFFGSSAVHYDTNDGGTDANLLQEAIWALMNPTSLNYVPSGNKFYNAVTGSGVGVATMNALLVTANSIGGVQIMNMKNGMDVNAGGSANAQDMLYYSAIPGGDFNPVPEPLSATIWLTTLIAGACVYRRRQNRI